MPSTSLVRAENRTEHQQRASLLYHHEDPESGPSSAAIRPPLPPLLRQTPHGRLHVVDGVVQLIPHPFAYSAGVALRSAWRALGSLVGRVTQQTLAPGPREPSQAFYCYDDLARRFCAMDETSKSMVRTVCANDKAELHFQYGTMNVWGVQAFFAALRENTAVHTLSISHVRVAGISAFVQEAQKTWNERPALKKFSVQLYITTSCNEKLAAQFPRTDPSVIQAICTRHEKPYSFSVER